MKHIITIFLSLTVSAYSSAADSNLVFLPYNPVILIGRELKNSEIENEMSLAKKLPECQPANLDPAGNWGEVVAGLQCSLRFSKQEYAPNEAIEASVILRNTTTNALNIHLPTQAAIQFVLLDTNKLELATSPAPLSISGPSRISLPAQRQIKYQFVLNQLFGPNTNGTYLVRAGRSLGAEGFRVQSRDAKVEIWAPRTPSQP